MDRFFSLDMSGGRFLRNTLIASLAGLCPLLLTYVLLTPSFASSLFDGGPPLARFLRQVVSNGLPVVFVVNYISFFIFARVAARRPDDRGLATALATDFALRLFAFAGLHALIFVLSADWFGSFAGSRLTALKVVAPTLSRSAQFENLSGVYLYATLVSAVPVHAAIIGRSATLNRLSSRFPGKSLAALSSLALAVIFVLTLMAISAGVARLQSG